MPQTPLSMRLFTLLCAAVAMTGPVALAQAPVTPAKSAHYTDIELAVAREAIAAALKSNLAYDILASLTTEVGARPAGSVQDARAVAWAQAKLKKLGFDAVWTEPVKVTAWERGAAHAEIVAPFPQPLAVTALGKSPSTSSGGVSAEVAYYADFEALISDFSERAKGRIVFVDEKMKPSKDGSTYDFAVRARLFGAAEAAKRGGVAVLTRSAGTDTNRLPHTGSIVGDPLAIPVPALAMSIPDADLLARQIQGGSSVKVHLHTQNRSIKDADSANVIAEWRAEEDANHPGRAKQIVGVGAHLDSWDLGTGALDDGAGIAIVTAAARIVRDAALAKGVKPKRSLRIVYFANEENGFDGAKAYLARHGKDRHQLVAEADHGDGAAYRLDTGIDARNLKSMSSLRELLAPLGVDIGNNTARAASDFGAVATGAGLPVAAVRQDATRYFDYHHTANDTLDKVNPETLRQNVAVWTALIWWAMQAEDDFGPAVTAVTPSAE